MKKRQKIYKIVNSITNATIAYVIPIIMFIYIADLTIYIRSEIQNKKELRKEFLTIPPRPEFQTKFIKEEMRNADKNIDNSFAKILAIIAGSGIAGYTSYRRSRNTKDKEVNQ